MLLGQQWTPSVWPTRSRHFCWRTMLPNGSAVKHSRSEPLTLTCLMDLREINTNCTKVRTFKVFWFLSFHRLVWVLWCEWRTSTSLLQGRPGLESQSTCRLGLGGHAGLSTSAGRSKTRKRAAGCGCRRMHQNPSCQFSSTSQFRAQSNGCYLYRNMYILYLHSLCQCWRHLSVLQCEPQRVNLGHTPLLRLRRMWTSCRRGKFSVIWVAYAVRRLFSYSSISSFNMFQSRIWKNIRKLLVQT